MHRIYFLSIYPELVRNALGYGTLQQARSKDLVAYEVINLRDFAVDQHGTIDDRPYGGGDGMIMRIEPIYKALQTIPDPKWVIFPCPKGERFLQEDAERLSQQVPNQNIVFLCGRFGGVDQRVIDHCVNETFSLGDFVASGGEFPSLTLLESIIRLVPGVLGNQESHSLDSFSGQLASMLEPSQYTRPAVFQGLAVPEVLQCGNHAAIQKWRQTESERLTKTLRPDLIEPALARGAKHGKP